jgi:P-type Cu2+ transporter
LWPSKTRIIRLPQGNADLIEQRPPPLTEATAADQNTLLNEIARLMAAAEQARGRYVRPVDRAAQLYAPAVHILGLVTLLGWVLTGHGWEMALTAAIGGC